MHRVEPEVHVIAATEVDESALADYLSAIGARLPDPTRPDDPTAWQPWYTEAEGPEELVEVMSRSCYMSFGTELNPNITRVREGNAEHLANIIKSGHGSVLEHGWVSFMFRNVSRVFCYDEQTEVLTDGGWKPWPEVRGDELFATLNPGTGFLEYQPALEHFSTVYVGPMYEVRSQQVDLLVTPEHRMWVRPQDTRARRRGAEPFAVHRAEDLLHRRVSYQSAARWRGQYRYKLSVPGVMGPYSGGVRRYPRKTFPARAFLRLLGYYLAEGHTSASDTTIVLTQNPGPVQDRMRQTILALGLTPSTPPSAPNQVRFKCYQLYRFLRDLGHAVEKRVPQMVKRLSPPLLRDFLHAVIEGDGNVHMNGHQVIYTSSSGLAGDLQALCIKAGWGASVRVDNRIGLAHAVGGETVAQTVPNYIVSVHKPSSTRPMVNTGRHKRSRYWNEDGYHDRLRPYAGRVYCVRTENGLLFVRRNGKAVVSGNTHELVRHRTGVAISQESLRYVRLNDLGYWVPSCFADDEVAAQLFADAVEGAEAHYQALIRRAAQLELHRFTTEELAGLDQLAKPDRMAALEELFNKLPFSVKKAYTSAARRVAPIGLATNIGWSCNFRALRHVCEMRTDEAAEEEIRLVFQKVQKIAHERWPALMQLAEQRKV